MEKIFTTVQSKATRIIVALVLALGLAIPAGLTLNPAQAQAAGITYNDGGKTLSDMLGISGGTWISYLQSHMNDDYYLGTPYPMPENGYMDWGKDNRNPNGDSAGANGANDKAGQAYMNCTGFVWHALYKASGKSYDDAYANIPGISGWVTYLIDNNIEYKTYSADVWNDGSGGSLMGQLLQAKADGDLEEGDLIWMWDLSNGGLDSHGLPMGVSDYHHIGIYLGDDDTYTQTSSPNKQPDVAPLSFWHSSHGTMWYQDGAGGVPVDRQVNAISCIEPKAQSNPIAATVIKFDKTGWVDLQKVSANPEISDNNECYSYEKANYGVYKDQGCSQLVTTIETNKDGYVKSEALKAGSYWVKEIDPPAGYARDEKAYPVEVTSGNTTRVNTDTVSDIPQNDPAGIWIAKKDNETGEDNPLNGAALENAEFTIDFFGGQYDTVDEAKAAVETEKIDHRTWVVKTNENGYANLSEQFKVSGNDFYYYRGEVVIPLGTLFIRETKAPEGYLLGTNGSAPLYTEHVTGEGTAVKVTTFNAPTDSEQVMRGSLQFKKHDEETNAALANVPFMLISLDNDGNEVESHVVVTDANGQFNTNTFDRGMNTNANDAAVTKAANGAYVVDESKLTYKTGTWFGSDTNGNKAPIDNKKNPLPYGKYRLVELPVAANEGMNLVNVPVDVYANNLEIDLGTIDDRTIYIGTTATDGEDGDKFITAEDNVVIKDTIEYTNLTKGETYTMKGVLVDPETSKPLLDANGKEITAEKTFEAPKANGTVEVEFTFDASKLGETDIVVFEECLDAKGTVVAEHKNPDDTFQTVTTKTPEIGTKATDGLDKDSVASADPSKGITIVDTVTYKNLRPNKEYTLTGTLMDKTTGEPFLDVDGKEITATTTFTPEESKGSVDVTFNFGAVVTENTQVVAFETCSREDKVIAVHTDINDEGQTITIIPPEIGTKATDGLDGDEFVSSDPNDTVTIVDTVEYKNLLPNKEYTLTGTLMDKTTGEPFLDVDGKEITATTTFTPEESKGSVEVEFVFDTVVTEDTQVVAFETCSREDKVVAVHTDINDEGQTVTIIPPEIGTTLMDSTDGDHEALSGQAVKLVDVVEYSGLVAGKEYVCQGTLMDKETGKELLIDGKKVTGETTFTAEQSEGTVEIEFIVDASKLANKTTVAYEYLYQDKTEVATHTDINDSNQSVTFVDVPSPETTNTPSSTSSKGYYDKTGMDNMIRLMCAVAGLALAGGCAAAYGIRRRRNAENNSTPSN